MNNFDWKNFLKEESKKVIAKYKGEWESWVFICDGDDRLYYSFEEMVKTLGMVNSWI